MVINFCALNEKTIWNGYPFPNIIDIFIYLFIYLFIDILFIDIKSIKKCKNFNVFDLAPRFHQCMNLMHRKQPFPFRMGITISIECHSD